MAADTLFRIASMTKPITSVAVMMLVEQGRVLLNDPVARYLPEFADAKVLERVGDEDAFRLVEPARPMTVRHLLTHTSGLTYGQGHGVLDSYYRVANITGTMGGPETLAATVARIARVPLLYHPGERWEYGCFRPSTPTKAPPPTSPAAPVSPPRCSITRVSCR